MKRAVRNALALASLLGSAGCFVCDGCIARGARVRTRKGDRAIEDVEVGDEILCCDPVTGALHETIVTHVKRAHRECVRLAGDGFQLVCTSNHPLFDPVAKEWANAGDWALGQRSALLQVVEEQVAIVQVTRREVFHAVSDVFDLTVEHELHTFIANGIVVHYKPPPFLDCGLPDGGRAMAGASCECPNGTGGSLTCDGQGALAFCTSCSTVWCVPPDGGLRLLRGEACTCEDGGMGQVACDDDHAPASCLFCSGVDAGP